MTTGAIGEPAEEHNLSPSEQQPHRAAYTVMEVAALLGLSPGNTYALVRSGAIPALRMGGRWIVPKQRFHRWLDKRSAR
jgi:excisionase family DNA binding protein